MVLNLVASCGKHNHPNAFTNRSVMKLTYLFTFIGTNVSDIFEGPYADHILISQGAHGSSTFFDDKLKPIFFSL